MAIKTEGSLSMFEIDAEFFLGKKPWSLSAAGFSLEVSPGNQIKMSNFYGQSASGLIDRGMGLIYDKTLNITWLQDTNYAKTSGHDSTGKLFRDDAVDWVSNLDYRGITDWRLPSAKLVGDNHFTNDGSSDYGWNNTRSEMGHMYYNNLNNSSFFEKNGDYGGPMTGDLDGRYYWNPVYTSPSGAQITFLNMTHTVTPCVDPNRCVNGYEPVELGAPAAFDGYITYWLNESLDILDPGVTYHMEFTFGGGQVRPTVVKYGQGGESGVWPVRDGDLLPKVKIKDGMIYDNVLDITWLQDANYAKTSGHDSDGKMTWDNAKDWVSNLNYKGITDWRLPSAKLLAPPRNDTESSVDGSTDITYNSMRSEMGRMYYFYLGNLAQWNTNEELQSGYGVTNTSFTDAAGTRVSIHNFHSDKYWCDERYTPPRHNNNFIWVFDAASGYQWIEQKNTGIPYSWAVHDGDVTDDATE